MVSKDNFMSYIIQLKANGMKGIPNCIGKVYELCCEMNHRSFSVQQLAREHKIDKGVFTLALKKLEELGFINYATFQRGGTAVTILEKELS